MKRVLVIFLTIFLLFSAAFAESTDSSIYADVIIEKMENLEVVDLQRIRDEADRLIAKKQKDNAQDTSYLGVWQEKYFVDQFNDPTDEKYILGLFDGTFSNSVATNSSLKVKMLIYMEKGKPRIGIELYEYGSNKVKVTYRDDREYFFTVKDENGELHKFIYGMLSERMSFKNKDLQSWAKDEQEVLDMLKTKKTLKFSFYDNDEYVKSTYRFDIDDTTGFENALNWLIED